MDANLNKKSKAPRQSPTRVIGLLVSGAAGGIALALGFSRLVADACQGDPSCHKPLLALFGGIVLLQALTIIAVYALVDHLNQKSEERVLDALRR